MTEDSKLALVLGATGGIGGEVAATLLRYGWQVRALTRRPDAAAAAARPGLAAVSWVAGDAMDPAAVMAAADGARLIVHAVNPPGYRDWDKLVLPMLENTIAAAKAMGARIVLPGTVYNFGPDAFDRPAENAPQRPLTRKGAIRVRMEQRLRDAAQDGVRALVVRAGDFFGPHAGNNWFASAVIKPGRAVAAVVNPGRRGVGHQWAYLPDVAETMVRLVEREGDLGAFEVFHMDGQWDEGGTAMTAAIRAASGKPGLRTRSFPWWAVLAASPVVRLFGEMREMRYLWRVPLRMDNRRLVTTLGAEPHTPLDVAVRVTLEGLGCLPAAA